MNIDKKDLEFMPLGRKNLFDLYVFCKKNKIHKGFFIELFRLLNYKDTGLLVYYHNNLIGHLILTFKGKDQNAVIFKERAYMSYLYIEEEFRKMGIGKELVAYMKKYLKAKGYKQVSALVDQSKENLTRFYKNQGFVCVKSFSDDDFAFCLMLADLL